ncbi:MAG: ABC transporter permease [Chloroflexi bacterium]|nr:ABC transporter permease [Chloroflexota bacterium]
MTQLEILSSSASAPPGAPDSSSDREATARQLRQEVQRGRVSGALRDRVVTIFSPVILLVLWEALARSGLLDNRFFPPPSAVIVDLWGMLLDGSLLMNTGATLGRVGAGLLIGCVLGVVLGLVLGLVRTFRLAMIPILAVTMPIPKIALLPLLMLMLGLGDPSKVALVAISVFFIMAYNTMAGVVGIPEIYLDVGNTFGASRLNFYRTVAIPGSLPYMLTGFKLSVAVALLVVVPAEWSGVRSGLGYMINQAWNTFSILDMYVALIALGVLGYLSGLLLEELERWLVPWRK